MATHSLEPALELTEGNHVDHHSHYPSTVIIQFLAFLPERRMHSSAFSQFLSNFSPSLDVVDNSIVCRMQLLKGEIYNRFERMCEPWPDIRPWRRRATVITRWRNRQKRNYTKEGFSILKNK